MNLNSLRSSLILLLTAIIWGFAFTAQKVGMDHIGPFTYNAARFTIGAICVLIMSLVLDKIRLSSGGYVDCPYFPDGKPNKTLFISGALSGLCLFAGSSLQQAALLYTTVSRCSFITALYMVMVPLLAVFLKKKISSNVWAGVILAAIGFYFLCLLPGELGMNFGDLLTLLGSLCWAMQIIIIDYYVDKVDGVKLSAMQFVLPAILSIAFAMIFETIEFDMLVKAAVPVLYGGFLSIGAGFTLQIIGQKNTPPTLASLILSLESVFAVIGGAIILNEVLTGREILGCVLIFAGILLAQFPIQNLLFKKKSEK